VLLPKTIIKQSASFNYEPIIQQKCIFQLRTHYTDKAHLLITNPIMIMT